ncbi:MAG: C-GCAxxG-C-C family (seleno)protein [Candidatus Kapaibacterium sp.]
MLFQKTNSPNDTKKVFRKKGTCSHTMFYLLDREFGASHPAEERAADPLAGGISQHGYQCGMLWGAVMAAGAEAYRRAGSLEKAIPPAMSAGQRLLDSFKSRAKSHNCMEITDINFRKRFGIFKYLITGGAFSCFNLAAKWKPEACAAAAESLDESTDTASGQALTCTSELVRKMGGTDQQAAMASALAGGMALSGNTCGALGAAIWMKTLPASTANPEKSAFNESVAGGVIAKFMAHTGGETHCEQLCGRRFGSLAGHAEYVRAGGCAELINSLAGE